MNYLGFAAAIASAALMSCTGSEQSDSGVTDAGPGQTYTFVIDQLQVEDDSPDIAHNGFNLDDKYSTDLDNGGCLHQDYFAMFDNDQNCASVTNETCTASPNPGCAQGGSCVGGVDNQLPALASALGAANIDLRMSLSNTITNNQLSLIIRVSGVNDTTNDSSVRVAIYRAFPTFSDGCNMVSGGREYSIDRSFLTAGATDIDTGASVAFDGAIVNGRLQVRAGGSSGQFNLPLSFSGYDLNLPLNQVQMRANISEAGLTSGTLGGWVAGSDIIMAVNMIAPQYASILPGILGGLVDIQINGICVDQMATPAVYGGIAVGLGVHAVPATISTSAPIVDAAAAGTCGASTADGG